MPYDASTVQDSPITFERIEFFSGMDAFMRPTLLTGDTAAIMENRLITDNGKCKTRPGADALGGDVIGTGYTTRIQGMRFLDRGATKRLAAVCNQNVHLWDESAWGAAVAGWTATAATSQVEMAQFLNMLWLVDGTQKLYSFDGTTFTQINGGSDPPAGASIVCRHAERLFLAGYDGTGVPPPDQIDASDLLAAATGSWQPIKFQFRVGGDFDPIKALISLRGFWLACFKEHSVWLINTDPTATSSSGWTKQELTTGIGCVGKRAAVAVGGDVFFFSQDGIRSLKLSVGTEGAFEISPPLSQQLQPYVDRVNWSYASTICAHRYREFVFFAVPLDSATEPNYTLVFNVRLAKWMGFWTGWTPHCFETTRFAGEPQQLVIGDSAAMVNQWKDQDDQAMAATYQDNSTDIATLLRTKSFNYGEPNSPKDAEWLALFFGESFDVDCTVKVYHDQEQVGLSINILESDTQNQLPIDLPFDLAVARYKRAIRSLTGYGDFYEQFFEITTTAGNNEILALSAGAFVESFRDENNT